MTAPPSRAAFFAAPDHATAKSIIQQWFDYVVERLGGTAAAANSTEKDEASAAIGAVRTTQLYGRRNRLINGGFQINQRGLTSAGDDAYCLDRWYVLTESGAVTVAQQVDQEDGTPNNIRLTQPDVGAKQIALAQIIEAVNCKDLRGKTATLSARIRCSAAAQINFAVLEWTGTADAVASDVISAWSGSPTYVANVIERAKGTITPGVATWTDVPALSAAINTGANNLIVLFWSNADLPQGVTLDVARVQLEPGAYATPFEHRPVGQELALCQRYFQLFNGLAASAYPSGGVGAYIETTVTFAVAMRVSPTLTPGSLISSSNIAGDSLVPFNATGCAYSVAQGAGAGTFSARRVNNLATAEL